MRQTIAKKIVMGAIPFLLWQSSLMAQSLVESADSRTELNFITTISEEVDADTVKLTFSKKLTGKNQKSLTEELNKSINAVIEKGKQNPALTVRTGDYNFWSRSDKDKSIIWEMRGEVDVSSRDFEKAREFIVSTKDDMTLDGIHFSLSKEAQKSTEDVLLTKVAEAFKVKADASAKAFGFQNYTIKSIRLDTNSAQNRPLLMSAPKMMRAASFDAEAGDAVSLSGGKIDVTVSADASIVLY
ncbi:SIMPL domain-containing protein [Pelistega sp. NLN82]|uniref:SIMPL domain-containing protein n=1 Tax=Pelistega ratti TaxID=2652177 RepID=A0A6L9Y9U3_9BURK|nr:SIMPL domain-containing protein [Pelistega ratti]NEN76588.1 SIMPL domain-containing protein [Pelistega ratti]